jgi:hypothetical protein
VVEQQVHHIQASFHTASTASVLADSNCVEPLAKLVGNSCIEVAYTAVEVAVAYPSQAVAYPSQAVEYPSSVVAVSSSAVASEVVSEESVWVEVAVAEALVE